MLNKLLTKYLWIWMLISIIGMLFLMRVMQWQLDGTIVRDAFWVKCVYAVFGFWLLLPFMDGRKKDDDDDDENEDEDASNNNVFPMPRLNHPETWRHIRKPSDIVYYRHTPLSKLGFFTPF